MKRVQINKGKIGLVFKNGDYIKALTEGKYWLMPFEKVLIYDMAQPFFAPIELSILLKDENLNQYLTIVEIKDDEKVFQYENGNFKSILSAGRHAFWKGIIEYKFTKVDLSKIEITEDISLSILQRADVLHLIRVFVVESYEKGILFVDGKMQKELETGVYYFWKNPIPVAVSKADLRQLQLEISGQEMLTSDKAALRINFYAHYKVTDVLKVLTEIKDYEKQLYILLQLALREFVGTMNLDELLAKKEGVGVYILENLKDKAKALGIELISCGIRDIILPGDVKEIMNQVLIAQKKAQANIITRREETATTRSLLNTAKLMEDNAMLFKLKEMEYVEKIADKINSISLSGGNQIVDQLKDIFIK